MAESRVRGGQTGDASDGLTRFKRGWSPLCRPVYLGRHVACPAQYRNSANSGPDSGFFPAYQIRRRDGRLKEHAIAREPPPLTARSLPTMSSCLSASRRQPSRGRLAAGRGCRELRYAVMLSVIASTDPRPIRLLDFGCGAGHLLEYIRRLNLPGISYHGMDLSERFLSVCRSKFPDVPLHLHGRAGCGIGGARLRLHRDERCLLPRNEEGLRFDACGSTCGPCSIGSGRMPGGGWPST